MGPRFETTSSKLPSGQNSRIMTTLCSVKKQSNIRVVNRQSGSTIYDSSFKTHTSWPSLSEFYTYYALDFVTELFYQLQWEQSDSYHPLGLDDDALVDLGKRPLPQKITFSILVLSVFQRLHSILFNYSILILPQRLK